MARAGGLIGRLDEGIGLEIVLARRVGGEPVAASDIYSFGLVLYELAAGRAPYTARTPNEWYRAHLAETPAPFPAAEPPFPPRFHQLVMRMLAKAPRQRPTPHDVLRELYEIEDHLYREKRG